MSDPAPEAPERPWPLRWLKRWRAVLVLVPLLAGLLIAAAVGARMLRADVDRTEPEPDVTCWDGTEGPAAGCTEPTGVAGLRWVFPALDPDECRRVEARDGAPKSARQVVQLVCRVSFDSRSVRLTYTRRPSVGASAAALRKSFDGAEASEAGDDRVSYRDRTGSLGARVGVAYTEHPFSVIVEGPDADLRDRALKALVRFRAADQIRVRPATE